MERARIRDETGYFGIAMFEEISESRNLFFCVVLSAGKNCLLGQGKGSRSRVSGRGDSRHVLFKGNPARCVGGEEGGLMINVGGSRTGWVLEEGRGWILIQVERGEPVALNYD